MCKIAETIERIILKSSAHQKLAITKPGTKAAVAIIKRVFKIMRKIPKVKIVKGKVIKTSIGRTKALINPKTKATIKATPNPVTVTPGNR